MGCQPVSLEKKCLDGTSLCNSESCSNVWMQLESPTRFFDSSAIKTDQLVTCLLWHRRTREQYVLLQALSVRVAWDLHNVVLVLQFQFLLWISVFLSVLQLMLILYLNLIGIKEFAECFSKSVFVFFITFYSSEKFHVLLTICGVS